MLFPALVADNFSPLLLLDSQDTYRSVVLLGCEESRTVLLLIFSPSSPPVLFPVLCSFSSHLPLLLFFPSPGRETLHLDSLRLAIESSRTRDLKFPDSCLGSPSLFLSRLLSSPWLLSCICENLSCSENASCVLEAGEFSSLSPLGEIRRRRKRLESSLLLSSPGTGTRFFTGTQPVLLARRSFPFFLVVCSFSLSTRHQATP